MVFIIGYIWLMLVSLILVSINYFMSNGVVIVLRVVIMMMSEVVNVTLFSVC